MTLAEQLEHLPIERRNVLRLAARHQPLLGDHFLIDPGGARVREIGFEGWPRRHLAAAYGACIDERPGAVADGGDRLGRIEKSAHEGDSRSVDPQLIWIDDPA